jgi:FKBP12-rapamycin complex-associated protein
VWQRILCVRTLVGFSAEDMDSGLKFASLCRRSGRMNVARRVLEGLGIDATWLPDIAHYPTGDPTWQSDVHPRVMYTFLKHLWSDGQRNVALAQMAWLSKHFAGSSDRHGVHHTSTSSHSLSHSSRPGLSLDDSAATGHSGGE